MTDGEYSELAEGFSADLPFDYGDVPERPALPVTRKCRRHDWYSHPSPTPCYGENGEIYLPPGTVHCRRCFTVRDPERARRGRNNRLRGNSIERQIGKELGLKRVGQYGGPDDLSGEWLVVQVKSGSVFPERVWGWLQTLPANANQTRAVVLTDAPGPGHKRRAVVVVTLDDWRALHGGTPR